MFSLYILGRNLKLLSLFRFNLLYSIKYIYKYILLFVETGLFHCSVFEGVKGKIYIYLLNLKVRPKRVSNHKEPGKSIKTTEISKNII